MNKLVFSFKQECLQGTEVLQTIILSFLVTEVGCTDLPKHGSKLGKGV